MISNVIKKLYSHVGKQRKQQFKIVIGATILASFAEIVSLGAVVPFIAVVTQPDEIFSLEAQALLYRLYHQEKVSLFDPQPVSYQCGCSHDKCLGAISQIEPSEIELILAEQSKISMTCDYCLTTYDFFYDDLKSFISKDKN